MAVLREVGSLFAEWSARRAIRRLIDQFGQAGLAAASTSPGLGAALDQHTAAVRDLLEGRSRGRAVRLAAYARSLVDEQRRGGGAVRTPGDGQWELADWAALRLLAVCELGRELAARPS